MNLIKNAVYVYLENGRWSLGRYLGKSKGFMFFMPSAFIYDSGFLSNGITEDVLKNGEIKEVPDEMYKTETGFLKWLSGALD
jgi:hypothetical protein